MKNEKCKNINKELLYEILQYILIFMVILECNSVYSQLYGYHLIVRAIMTILSIFLIILLMILKKKIKIHKSIIIFIIYDVICSIILFFYTDSFSGKGIISLVFFMFLPLLQIYLSNFNNNEFKELLRKFVDVVIILSVLSLVFWIFSAVFNIVKPTNVLRVVWGDPYSEIKSYLNLHFDTQDVWWITGTPLIRNTGVFVEGPMYALILLVALIFNNLLCFERTKSNFIKTVILFITMITTISVTGIICSIIILGYTIIKHIVSMDKLKRRIYIIVLITTIIVMLPLGVSLISKKMNTGSASHRNTDIKIGLKTFLEKPLLGQGVNHERANEVDYENGYGYSNSVIPILTDGGIILSMIYIYPLIVLVVYSLKNKKVEYLCFILVYFIILFTTLIPYRLAMMLMISIMIAIKDIDYNDKEYQNITDVKTCLIEK